MAEAWLHRTLGVLLPLVAALVVSALVLLAIGEDPLSVFGLNLLGDGLRDAIDPTLRARDS